MAKGKSLLTESEVRKFMKFANIPHLAENFFKEGSCMEEEGLGMEEEGVGMEEEAAEEEEAVEEPVAEEPPADMDMGDEAGGLEAEAERVLSDLAALLSKAGVPVNVEGDKVEKPPADDMGDMGDMGDEVEELEEMGVYDEEALAESVLKRVMARVKGLNEAKERKAKLAKRVDEVTDRIMKRITMGKRHVRRK